MSSQRITSASLQTLIEKDGAVILARKIYDALLKKIEAQKTQIKKATEEAMVNQIITQGDAELENRKTIIASSSQEALQKYHARKQSE